MGVHLAPNRIRAVKLAGRARRCEVFEADWNPDQPAETARAIKEQFGGAGEVSLTVDVGFTFVKRVNLPPLQLGEKRRVLELEPERYFPVRGERVIVSLSENDDLAYAVREGQLEDWISAMEALGPVELVEPAPHSLARSLKSVGVTDAAVMLFADEGSGAALIEIHDGAVHKTRRLFGSQADVLVELAGDDFRSSGAKLLAPSTADVDVLNAMWPDANADTLPHIEHCPAEYAVAYGAAIGIGKSSDSTFTTAELARRWVWRERRRLAVAVSAFIAATVLLVFAVDNYRARAQRGIESEIAALRAHGQEVLELQSEALRIQGNLETLTGIIADRMDPLEVLLTVSRLLPDDAYVRTIDGSESEWRVDGYAGDAANLIPVFEANPLIENVRFVRATTRVTINNENYEDFSLVFRLVSQAQ